MTITPLVQAEQAVLGAVLLEPRQLGRLSGWLRPEHFYRPAHAAVYAAMLDLHRQEHPATTAPPDAPTPLGWVNATQERASSQTRGVTPAYVHSLATACPQPAHAPVYGRMVLEGAIHRSVTQHAVRLHRAARSDAVRGTGVEETLHRTQVLAEVLDDLGRRWGAEPRPAQPGTGAPKSTAAHGPVDERVLADEEFLLGTLASHPEQLSEVVGWLRPEDFAGPGHGQLYRALGALHHRGEPVDQLTVLWECQRRGALANGTLDADRVRTLCQTAGGGSADYFGEQVLDASLLRTAADSAQQVRALAEDDALAPGQLINQVLSALVPLNEVRRRRDAANPTDTDTAAATAAPNPARAAAARARSLPTRTGPPAPPKSAPAPPSVPQHSARRSPS